MRKRLLWLFGLGVLAASGCASDGGSKGEAGGEPAKELVKWVTSDGEVYYCQEGKVGCEGICVIQDEFNCGSCGNLCSPGSTCTDDGKCICEYTQTECSLTCVPDGCVDVRTNPNHCGSGDIKCDIAKGEVCSDGVCSTNCPTDLTNCNGSCVDIENNKDFCGSCGTKCPEPSEDLHVSRSYCSNGECQIQCSSGYVDEDEVIGNGCETQVTFTCGNGIVELGEMCDGLRLNDHTCTSIVGEGSTGVLTCRPDCLGFDTSMCSASTTCGNRIKDGAEVCDGGDLGGATCESVVGSGSTGYLGCNSNCSDFDTSFCSAPSTCNGAALDEGEVCDGANLNGATCETVVGPGSTGILACAVNCYDYDRSHCTAASICGNGLLEAGEACDGTNFNGETCESLVGKGSRGTLKCNSCVISTENCSAASTCGNNIIDGNDKCDGSALNGKTCHDVVGEGSEGTLGCRDNCSDYDISRCTAASKCGNGIIEEGEACDTTRLNDRTCATEVGFGSTGKLVCNSTCTGFITSGCSASTTCGNGKLETNELCDTTNLKGATCDSAVGSGSVGTVLCGSDCKTLNLSGCSAATSCGNGKLDDGEVCDGTNFNKATCETVVGKGSSGTLSCGDGCKHFDISNCSKSQFCGDGEINDKEVCDGNNVAGRTCADVVGFGSQGPLKCADNCMAFDTSKCTAEKTCGNGKLDEGEVCDGTLLNGATCSALVGYGSTGTLVCNKTCTGFDFDASSCTEAKTCGNGVLDEGEVCDGYLLNGKTCAQQVGFGSTGTPACNNTCTGFTNGTCTAALTCGNGKLDSGEQCDTNFLNGATCESVVGVGSTGTLKCDSNCQFNTTNCEASRGCGNGTIEDNEECDGKVFRNNITTCNAYAPSLYESGTVTCDKNCRVNVSACKSWCGNGVVNTSRNGVYIGEVCDGEKFPSTSNTCEKVVGTGSTGELVCADDCKAINTNMCTAPASCGDGIVNQSNEDCDGGKYRLGSDDCSAYGDLYQSGTKVSCLSNCTVDTSACKVKAYCGDGIVNNSEECDRDAFLLGEDSCAAWDPNKYSSGKVKCNNTTCKIDFSACIDKPTVKCGNGKLDEGEWCDGNQFDDDIKSCSDWDPNYGSGTLKCTSDCQIDDSACKVKEFCGDGVLNNGEVCDGTKFVSNRTSCKTIFPDLYSSGSVTCKNDCTYDTSACVAYCGNGSVNTTKGEACDHSATGDKFPTSSNSCAKVMGAGYTGTLACSNDCSTIITTGCKLSEYCGDGIVNGDESCDGTKFLNNQSSCSYWNSTYSSGNMTCNSDCTMNESACVTPAQPECGDGIINLDTEECDGKAIRTGLSWSCTDYDPAYASGTLTCANNCKFSTSSCVLKPTTKCGNGQLDDDEWCDGTEFLISECAEASTAYSKGTLKCDADCDLDFSGCTLKACGDGVLSDNEECDGTKFQPEWDTCAKADPRYGGGSLKCVNCEVDTSSCTLKCGNNKLDDDEWCDGNKFQTGASTCNDWLPGSTGTLSCNSNCEVVTTGCKAAPSAYCGDGVANTAAEDCDGNDILTTSCVEWSPSTYISGTIKCTNDCKMDESGCVKHPTSTCGNGKVETGEDCDKTAFAGNIKTCAAYSSSYESGNLKCTSSCKIDTNECVLKSTNTCGNGKLDSGELCDGTKFVENKDSCTQWGDFASGVVTCSADCQIVTAACVKKEDVECGDGKINRIDEECDTNTFLNGSNKCSDYSSTFTSGTLKCTECKIDTSSCTKPSTSKCGNGQLDDDEWCDGTKFFDGITKCSDYSSAYNSGTLKCNSACEFDISQCTRVKQCTVDMEARCEGQSLQLCDGTLGEWIEILKCTTGYYCDSAAEKCQKTTEPTVHPAWCNFQWLTNDANHFGYGRILLPDGKTPDDVIAYMACTPDLTKPVSTWTTVDAYHNASCTDCYSNTEFMTVDPYAGIGGTNYCTFIFDFIEGNGNNKFACLPIQSGAAEPIHIVDGTTKLLADQTRQFTRGSCTENTFQCVGSSLQMCIDGTWGEMEVCASNKVCDANIGECVAAGASYDNFVTMNNWYASNKTSYSENHSETMSDGSKITVTGAFYIADHIIDGVTAVFNAKNTYSTSAVISNLSSGVGLVSFKYQSWGASGDNLTLNVTDGTTTKTVTVSSANQYAQTASFTLNNASAKTITISPVSKSSAARVLIDDIRWTSAP